MFNSRKQTVLEDQPAVGKVKMCSRVEQCVMWASHLFHQTKHNSGLKYFFQKNSYPCSLIKEFCLQLFLPTLKHFKQIIRYQIIREKYGKKIV